MATLGWTRLGVRIFLLVALILASPAAASAQRAGGPGFSQGFGPGFAPPNPTRKWQADLAAAKGLLILNGQYVPLPCEVTLDGQSLIVNDVRVESRLAGDGQGKPQRVPDWQARRLGNEIVQNLSHGHLVVALADLPVVVLPGGQAQSDLLKTLLADSGRVTPVSLKSLFVPEESIAAWDAWLADFAVTDDFRLRATQAIERYERIEAEANSAIAANRRLNSWSYPLSMLGMIATTLGIGHLLSHRPPVDAKSLETDASPLAIRVLSWSLVLVVLYSALDLTWTILAHQAGQMLELNPIGSRLIDNPLYLIAFKSAATGMAVCLLFVLRRYRKAQLAAWWVCLVCTLLTARWLTISPMFAA